MIDPKTLGTDQLSGAPEESQLADDMDMQQQAQEQSEQLQQAFQQLSLRLVMMRDRWIAARQASGWDERARLDSEQYDGTQGGSPEKIDMMDSVRAGVPLLGERTAPTRSRVVINITRPKTNALSARLEDILLPTDELNFSVNPTPIAAVVQSMGGAQEHPLNAALQSQSPIVDPATGQQIAHPQTGQPLTQQDLAGAVQEDVHKAAKAMEETIADQLTECDYNSEQRKVIQDMCRLGVGVLKGPNIHSKYHKRWTKVDGATWRLDMVEEQKPASWRVDPRFVWEDPACGEDIQRGRGLWELGMISRRALAELRAQPGYLSSVIDQVISEEPKAVYAVQPQIGADADGKAGAAPADKPFEHWMFVGTLSADELALLGVDVQQEAAPTGQFSKLAPVSESDALTRLDSQIVACLELVNDKVIRAYLSPAEDGSYPYDFVPLERKADSCRGYSVPYLLRSQSRIVTAAWRMMMDNAGTTVGGQIIMKRTVKPMDQSYAIRSNKVWHAAEDVEDVSKAFAVVQLPNNQGAYADIIKMAQELAEMETSLPQILQGAMGAVPDSVGGMQMLLNNSTTVIRRYVKQYDDCITKPHIRRYYDYNMAYNEDPAIKGDFSVDARGSSALLVRDVQDQAMMGLLPLANDGVYSQEISPRRILEKVLQSKHLRADDVLLSDVEKQQMAQAKAQQPQAQADPRVLAAQATAQSRVQSAQTLAEAQKSEVALRAQIARDNAAARVQELAMKRELALLDFANRRNINLDKLKGMLTVNAMRERNMRELAASETRLKLMTGSGI